MYAVIKTGGKEYRVQQGDLIRVEKLEGNVGDPVSLGEVLMVSDQGEAQFGTPLLTQASITAKIVEQAQGKKVLTYKMKRRKNYRRFKGHRQFYTTLKIDEIRVALKRHRSTSKILYAIRSVKFGISAFQAGGDHGTQEGRGKFPERKR